MEELRDAASARLGNEARVMPAALRLLVLALALTILWSTAAPAEELEDPHDVQRLGSLYNTNFDHDGIDDYRVDADIALLQIGVVNPPESVTVNWSHEADCVHPDPLNEWRGFYTSPNLADPDWEPNDRLNAAGERGPFGCLDNQINPTPQQIAQNGEGVVQRAAEFDGNGALGGVAPGARIWNIRVIACGLNLGACRNPLSFPEHPEYDPEAPLYQPELATKRVIAGLDWVADHADQIEVAELHFVCASKGHPEVIAANLEAIACDPIAMNEAIEDAVDKGVVVVTLGGNFGADASAATPQGSPGAVSVSHVADTDGKPGGEGPPCGSAVVRPDDHLNPESARGTLIDIAAPGCGDTAGAMGRVAGAAAALASQCEPQSRDGAEFIVDTLMAEGDTGGISEGGWQDDAQDPWKEPLLNLSDEDVFDPVLLHTSNPALSEAAPSDGCAWRSHQAESDVNSDGRADLIAVESSGKQARVFLGAVEGYVEVNGAASLQGQLDSALSDRKGQYLIDTADVDGDRHADLITAVHGDGIFVYPGNEQGGFGAPAESVDHVDLAFNGSKGSEPVGVADVTGDGKSDLVARWANANSLVVFPGKADGTFGTVIASAFSISFNSALLDRVGNYALDVVDVTGDGYADLVSLNTDNVVRVYGGRASGKFLPPVSAATVNPIMDDGEGQEPVGLGDVDRDRRADLLTLDESTLKLYKGKADGTFAEPTQPYAGSIDSNLMDAEGDELIGLLDYSRDGLADLVSVTESGEVRSYRAQRDSTFANPTGSGPIVPSTRHGATGSEFVAEKPILRRAGCQPVICEWHVPPVAAYSFNEGAGTALRDSVGDHDGTILGAGWIEEGKYGSALDFDGTNDLVSIADAASLDLTNSFTLEAWVRPDTLSGGGPVLVKLENPLSPSGYLLSANITANTPESHPGGRVAKAGTNVIVQGPASLPAGIWSHLAFTSDGEVLRLYIDGKLVSTSSAISAGTTATSLLIGHNPTTNSYFDGIADEIRIYDVPLSESRIEADRDQALCLCQ